MMTKTLVTTKIVVDYDNGNGNNDDDDDDDYDNDNEKDESAMMVTNTIKTT